MQRGEEGRGAEYEQLKVGCDSWQARAVLARFPGLSPSNLRRGAGISCKHRIRSKNRSPQQPHSGRRHNTNTSQDRLNTDTSHDTHPTTARLENVRLNSTLLSIPSSPHLTILLIRVMPEIRCGLCCPISGLPWGMWLPSTCARASRHAAAAVASASAAPAAVRGRVATGRPSSCCRAASARIRPTRTSQERSTSCHPPIADGRPCLAARSSPAGEHSRPRRHSRRQQRHGCCIRRRIRSARCRDAATTTCSEGACRWGCESGRAASRPRRPTRPNPTHSSSAGSSAQSAHSSSAARPAAARAGGGCSGAPPFGS